MERDGNQGDVQRATCNGTGTGNGNGNGNGNHNGNGNGNGNRNGLTQRREDAKRLTAEDCGLKLCAFARADGCCSSAPASVAELQSCGCAAVRLCGCAAVRLCGCAAVRLCVKQ